MSVTPRELPEDVRSLLVARLPPEGGRVVVTWGQMLEERGRDRGLEKGRKEGLQQGLQQGVQEGQARMLLNLMHARFGALPEATEARVRAGTQQELDRWAERILTADSLDVVFG